MTTRRTFIQALAGIPAAASLGLGTAANAGTGRFAMVIGNGAYRAAPLANPVNDARAMAELFKQAGFSVDARVDATYSDLVAAIEDFGAAASAPQTRQVVFYYAGHGVQSDWRNYLLPVDAEVKSADQLRQRCVDLGLLLGKLKAGKDKTFIVILDACRDDPFGSEYRPQEKGLSQFDAPVGSLLAYATAPGRVASDGGGRNGLYTENLVRELSIRGTRIEDAFKRVRLNVRLSSRGVQVPWETTSLEEDVFMFDDPPPKPSEAELERRIEADITRWTAIKSSRNVEDWAAYLRTFPNGRFAEIAQVRLARLLADAEKPPVVSIAAAPPPTVRPDSISQPPPVVLATATGPAIEIFAGAAVPRLLQLSANPYSAGMYPLGRRYSVGDEAIFRVTDTLTGIEQRSIRLRVTRVDADADRVEINNGGQIWDSMGNVLTGAQGRVFDVPQQFSPAELYVGRRWTAAFGATEQGRKQFLTFDMRVTRKERISVPAGTFDAFKVEGDGYNMTNGYHLRETRWLVPSLNFPIRRERIARARTNALHTTNRGELVSLRQQAVDLQHP